MKKSLLLLSALLFTSVAVTAQEPLSAKARSHNAQTSTRAMVQDDRTRPIAAQAAPAMMAPTREVMASSSQSRAPRRSIADEVWYQRPEGSLYISGSSSGNYWSYLYMPAFTNVTWKNMSSKKEGTIWELVSTQNVYTMDANADYDFEFSLPKIEEGYISTFYIPRMTVGKISYTFGEDIKQNDELINSTVALINGDTLSAATQVNLASGYYYGFSNGSTFGNREATFTGDNGEDIPAVSDAIYEFYKKPLSPLYVTDIYFRVVNFDGTPLMNEDTEMKATFRKVDEEGNITDIIAEMPFTLADTTYCEVDNGKTFGAFIISQKEEDAFGTEFDVPFVIDSEFVIIISGFEQEGVNFSLYMTGDLKDVETDCFLNNGLVTPTCRSYVRADNGEPIDGLYYCQAITKEQSDRYNEEDGDNTDWTRHYNAVIHIECMNDVVSIYDDFQTMYAPIDGGTVYAVALEENEETGEQEYVAYGTLQYRTTMPRLSTWEGYEGEDNYQFENLPDWVRVTGHIDDYYYSEDGSDWATLTKLEADPLPESMEGRKAEIAIVSERGARATFIVRQGILPEDRYEATYAMEVDETHKSGDIVNVENALGDVVATLQFGFADQDDPDFNAAVADNSVAGFIAYTTGNNANGRKASGTAYVIAPKYDGEVEVAVALEANKQFYVLEDGKALSAYNGITKEADYKGTFKFNVKAGKLYTIYASSSKLGFYGFNYSITGTIEDGIQLVDNDDASASSQLYNLQGQRISTPTHGLYIMNGRKYMTR